MHCIRRAASRADWTAGNSRAIRIPMMAITTKSSIRVKPRRVRGFWVHMDRGTSCEGVMRTGTIRGEHDPSAVVSRRSSKGRMSDDSTGRSSSRGAVVERPARGEIRPMGRSTFVFEPVSLPDGSRSTRERTGKLRDEYGMFSTPSPRTSRDCHGEDCRRRLCGDDEREAKFRIGPRRQGQVVRVGATALIKSRVMRNPSEFDSRGRLSSTRREARFRRPMRPLWDATLRARAEQSRVEPGDRDRQFPRQAGRRSVRPHGRRSGRSGASFRVPRRCTAGDRTCPPGPIGLPSWSGSAILPT